MMVMTLPLEIQRPLKQLLHLEKVSALVDECREGRRDALVMRHELTLKMKKPCGIYAARSSRISAGL
jgi:hypothetical protein